MKLLIENWRKFITEDWRDTSWETDDEKVTIADVVDYLGDETVDISVLELSQQLPPLPTRGAERVAAANLDYPIIVVKSRGQYRSVLDGNHRLQKAIDEEAEVIEAKILDLDNPETPELFQKMFGGAEKSVSIKDVHELADTLNIPWDDDDEFMSWTKKLTGESHLDKMTNEELSIIYTALKKRGKKDK
jgi:hypothetical protein